MSYNIGMSNAAIRTDYRGTVLLFNKCGSGSTAARLHATSCPLVAAARASRGKVAVIDDPSTIGAAIADLEEREWHVKSCKCAKGTNV